MRKALTVWMITLLSAITLHAQIPGGGAPGARRGNGGNMNVGHLYGKVVDSKSNKGIDAATVQLVASKFDTTTKKVKDVIIATVLTQSNGDFSLENLPVFGKFKLRATVMGYKDYDAPVSFDLKMPQGGTGAQDRMQQVMNMVDKDLGNIKIEQSDANLGNVTVTASAKPFFEMGVDRKVFNVDKNLVSAGQTATEVMKQIPSVNVDIDGNVTLRNAAPTLFVDGRPTTLTMDQIPADIIDRVELITNPGAKYDASSGGGGILNIVLKKNIKRGYNGGIRAGVDSRGKLNLGGDLNYRQGKFNTFLSGNYNQRKSKFTTVTDRENLTNPTTSAPASFLHQSLNGVNNGEFAFLRGGFDYFMDNRNTFTVSGSYVHGSFKNDQPSVIDSTIDNALTSYSNQNSFSKFGFTNYGGQLSFKHNFAKNGHDITADVNYNSSTNDNNSIVTTDVFSPSGDHKFSRAQRTDGSGYNRFLTIQSDYENQLTENTKLEAGVRGAVRNFRNDNLQYLGDSLREDLSSHYKYTDQVYAAYATYSFKTGKWNYQLGLRAESSNYKGTLIGGSSTHQDTTFKVSYPVALFPSVFITYKLDDKDDIQINYSRKINRPGFFQLLPVVNVSDPQNPSQGNPGLKPEFTNSFELSYNKNYGHGGNFLASAYFRHTNDLLTNLLVLGPNPINPKADSVYYTTYANASSSITYGLELTNKLTLMRFWDLTLNVNLFNSKINTNNLKDAGSSNQRVSWFGKMNNTFKLPHGFSIQFSGDYQAKTVLPQNSNGNGGGGRGGGGGGGGMFGGSNFGTAQGYIKPRYGFDMAIRKDWTWKGGNSASVSLSMNDIFRTQLYSTYSESTFLIQNQQRRRDPQILRLNFSYRFGKFDASLFKRKNNKADQGGGMDMIGGG